MASGANQDTEDFNLFVDSEEEEIFFGPVTEKEISLVGKLTLRDSFYGEESPENSILDNDSTPTNSNNEDLIIDRVERCLNFSDAVSTSESPHFNSVNAHYTEENMKDHATSLLTESLLQTTFETTFASDSPLNHFLKVKGDDSSRSGHLKCIAEDESGGKEYDEEFVRFSRMEKEINDSLLFFEHAESECNEEYSNEMKLSSEFSNDEESSVETGEKYYDELAAILEFQAKYQETCAKKEISSENNDEVFQGGKAVNDLKSSPSATPKNVARGNLPDINCKIDSAKSAKHILVPNSPFKSKVLFNPSPIAKYIHENPSAPLIKNCIAKDFDLGEKNSPIKNTTYKKKVSDKENQKHFACKLSSPNPSKNTLKPCIKASLSEHQEEFRPILPVSSYKAKRNLVNNLDEITNKNTDKNSHIKQYFPSPTVVRYQGSSKVIRWANHLNIDENDSQESESISQSGNGHSLSINDSEQSQTTASNDSTVLDVKCSKRTNTLASNTTPLRF